MILYWTMCQSQRQVALIASDYYTNTIYNYTNTIYNYTNNTYNYANNYYQ